MNVNVMGDMIIYKTTNLLNNKIYIGKDFKNLSCYLGSGKWFKRALKKYGKENFKKETLELCTRNNICEREKHWIKKLHSRNPKIGYNITQGGDGGVGFGIHNPMFGKKGILNPLFGRKRSKKICKKVSQALKGHIVPEKVRRKISKSLQGPKNPNFGKHPSKETIEKLRLANIGKKMSLETRRKISLNTTGIKNHNFRKPMSKEQKLKISKANKGKPSWRKGKPLSEEHKRKISESHKYRDKTLYFIKKKHKGDN